MDSPENKNPVHGHCKIILAKLHPTFGSIGIGLDNCIDMDCAVGSFYRTGQEAVLGVFKIQSCTKRAVSKPSGVRSQSVSACCVGYSDCYEVYDGV